MLTLAPSTHEVSKFSSPYREGAGQERHVQSSQNFTVERAARPAVAEFRPYSKLSADQARQDHHSCHYLGRLFLSSNDGLCEGARGRAAAAASNRPSLCEFRRILVGPDAGR